MAVPRVRTTVRRAVYGFDNADALINRIAAAARVMLPVRIAKAALYVRTAAVRSFISAAPAL